MARRTGPHVRPLLPWYLDPVGGRRLRWMGPLILLAGCSVARTGLGARQLDGGMVGSPDAGRIDGGSVGRRDSGPMPTADSGPMPTADSGSMPTADSGPPPTPDAGPMTDAGPPDAGPSCSSLYDGADGYVLCGGEYDSACVFYTDPPGSSRSCNSVCASLGGSCVAQYDDGTEHCTRIGTGLCDDMRDDMICACSR